MSQHWFNTLRPRQNGCHFPDNIFKVIFFYENCWVLFQISLKYIPNGAINNNPALVLIMAWCWTGDKPLSEPLMAEFNDAHMFHSASVSVPLSEWRQAIITCNTVKDLGHHLASPGCSELTLCIICMVTIACLTFFHPGNPFVSQS